MTSRDRCGRGDGFTLVETLVVMSIIGLIAVVIGATFSVIVRSLPPTEARVDDARAQLGLTNWFPQDVLSADETGFEQGPYTARCAAGSVPSGSIGLLQLRWSEGSSVFVADYRYVRHGTTGTGYIARLSCTAGQAARSLKMTPILRDLSGTTQAPAPVNIDLVEKADGSGDRGVRFEVEIVDPESGQRRELISLDGTTANVLTTLPPTPATTTTTTPPTTSGANDPPTAGELWLTAENDTAQTVTLPATDPEGRALTVTVVAQPPELTVTNVGDVDVSVLATGGTVGVTYDFEYRVTDDANAAATGTVHVTIVEAPSPTTTSTTTTTTTTTTVPTCVASIASVTASTAQRTGQGHLNKEVVVSIVRNDGCGPLVLTFDPDPDDSNEVPESLAFNAGTSVTIDKNAYLWDENTSPGHPLTLRQGANGSEIDMERLVVS